MELISLYPVWIALIAAGYLAMPVLIRWARAWERRRQERLTKAISVYLAAVLIGYIEWSFFAHLHAAEQLTGIQFVGGLLAGALLVFYTWLLIIKMWG